jgi:hypothetical protein
MENLYSGMCAEIHMFTKIDIAKAVTPYEANQAIVPKALARAVSHVPTPLHVWDGN